MAKRNCSPRGTHHPTSALDKDSKKLKTLKQKLDHDDFAPYDESIVKEQTMKAIFRCADESARRKGQNKVTKGSRNATKGTKKTEAKGSDRVLRTTKGKKTFVSLAASVRL